MPGAIKRLRAWNQADEQFILRREARWAGGWLCSWRGMLLVAAVLSLLLGVELGHQLVRAGEFPYWADVSVIWRTLVQIERFLVFFIWIPLYLARVLRPMESFSEGDDLRMTMIKSRHLWPALFVGPLIICGLVAGLDAGIGGVSFWMRTSIVESIASFNESYLPLPEWLLGTYFRGRAFIVFLGYWLASLSMVFCVSSLMTLYLYQRWSLRWYLVELVGAVLAYIVLYKLYQQIFGIAHRMPPDGSGAIHALIRDIWGYMRFPILHSILYLTIGFICLRRLRQRGLPGQSGAVESTHA